MSSLKGCLSKFIGIVLFAALVGMRSSSVQAQVTNLSAGASVNFSNLVNSSSQWTGLSVMIGDKLFGNFGFQYLDTDMNSGNSLVPADLVLSALSNQVGFGVAIQLPLYAQSTDLKDLILQFTAQVTNSFNLISDVHLTVVGSAGGYGAANVSETIATNGFLNGSIANLAVNITSTGVTPPGGEDDGTLSTPQSKIWITKDVIVSGDPNGYSETNPSGDFATITDIQQTFSQIPEPSTMALLGLGMAGLLTVRRRK